MWRDFLFVYGTIMLVVKLFASSCLLILFLVWQTQHHSYFAYLLFHLLPWKLLGYWWTFRFLPFYVTHSSFQIKSYATNFLVLVAKTTKWIGGIHWVFLCHLLMLYGWGMCPHPIVTKVRSYNTCWYFRVSYIVALPMKWKIPIWFTRYLHKWRLKTLRLHFNLMSN